MMLRMLLQHYPINTYNSPQINATAPPHRYCASLDSSAVVAEEINKREIIIKN